MHFLSTEKNHYPNISERAREIQVWTDLGTEIKAFLTKDLIVTLSGNSCVVVRFVQQGVVPGSH